MSDNERDINLVILMNVHLILPAFEKFNVPNLTIKTLEFMAFLVQLNGSQNTQESGVFYKLNFTLILAKMNDVDYTAVPIILLHFIY